MLVAYTDDSSERVIEVRNALMKRYQMSNLGSAKGFLGLDIIRSPDGSIVLSQKTYIDSMHQEKNYLHWVRCHAPNTPNAHNTLNKNLLLYMTIFSDFAY